MKRILQHPASAENELTGPRYWRSLDELSGNPAFKDWMDREFQDGASEGNGVNRRHFVKIMAASFAMAGVGLAGCRRPEATIRPFSKESTRDIPGLPFFYATSLPDAYDNIPLAVETHGARPTKIEGNELYTPYGGATDLYSQASVLDLYDPDRATQSSQGTRTLTKAQVYDLLKNLSDDSTKAGGQGLAILAEPSTSPTRARLVAELKKKYPRLVWAEYAPVSNANAENALAKLFGSPTRAILDLSKAHRLLALDSDFLGRESGKLGHSRAFAAKRRVKDKADAEKMSRLYSVESTFTLTGTMSDHRLRIATAEMPAFTALLTAAVLKELGVESTFATELASKAVSLKVDQKWITEAAKDVISKKGESLVVAGSHLPEEVHLLTALLNDVLGATGKTVNYVKLPAKEATSLVELAASIRSGSISTLMVLGGNPVYNAPADLNWAALQKQVKSVIRYGYSFDETATEAGTFIAATHFLESWSDGRTFDGTLVPVQPMIQPIFEGIQEIELLARLAGSAVVDPYAQVAETFGTFTTDADKGTAFNTFLRDGFLPGSGFAAVGSRPAVSALKALVAKAPFTAPTLSGDALEVRFMADAKVHDGRYNNNGWLQECPEPMTKLTWDNAILISPALADHLHFDTKSGTFLIGGIAKKSANFSRGREVAPVATLTVNGVTLTGPVHIQPGLSDWTVVVNLGYGRTKVGRVGKGTGFDVYPAITSKAPFVALGGKVAIKHGDFYKLANTQEHWSIEGRDIVREGNVDTFLNQPDFANKMGMESHSPAIYGKDKNASLQDKVNNQYQGATLYKIPQFSGAQQWGMSVDLNTCIGCNACMVACQSENNIPIVGKDQVTRGREMHWIRIDRYYASGDPKANQNELPRDPQASLMPMMCQHCENAPCEQVCPVNATVHDDQGLNVMAYNRCIGTKYCANNCPYKVRRFNFFDWNKREIGHFYEGPFGPNKYKQGAASELQRMRANPEVSVRMRGVMEKCTFCQQRIQNAKIAQKAKTGLVDGGSDDVSVPEGIIRTACMQVCPTGAIVFGDVADKSSAVSKSKDNDRDYSVLGYLNVRPRTTYLARLRNPNPRMPDFSSTPLFQKEYEIKSGHGGHGESTHEAKGTEHKAEGAEHSHG
ncbi:MAG: TAT-variant-translocated molybdopterin oxidoreductase [Verrucomicrobiota bacterium]|nr:TAT-variant-translocated molybdopterin oxidoreductase [Verrucomicrobiota bacterium]